MLECSDGTDLYGEGMVYVSHGDNNCVQRLDKRSFVVEASAIEESSAHLGKGVLVAFPGSKRDALQELRKIIAAIESDATDGVGRETV